MAAHWISSFSVMFSDCYASEAPATATADYPREYGPDFINYQGTPGPAYSGMFVDLDDHLLPHIDPLLTINQQLDPYLLVDASAAPDQSSGSGQSEDLCAKWEPPIITKIYQNFGHFGQMADFGASIMSATAADIY